MLEAAMATGVARNLLIGIGNPLRGDDGVGRLLAEEWEAVVDDKAVDAALRVRSVHQLTPELVADLAGVDRVLFIDAWLSPAAPAAPVLQRLPASVSRPVACGESVLNSHHLTAAQLLTLARSLWHAEPEAAMLRIPATDIAHGTRLSVAMELQLPAARRLVRRWLEATALCMS
jgi:hydrogenase maturation protease